jgi:ATP-dependent HslUV protease subunit HslV
LLTQGSGFFAGHGKVTFVHNRVINPTAVKVRRLYHGKVLAGFAGSVADALTLFEHFEGKLEESHGNLSRAAVSLSREWRTDRMLGKLEALLLVADQEHLFILSGTGEVIEPDDFIAAIGSGGSYALAAARAFTSMEQPMALDEVVRRSLDIAADICIYTNHHLTVETLG